MADNATIKVRNVDRLRTKLRKLRPALDVELDKAGRGTADDVAMMARSLTQSSRVRASITVEKNRRGNYIVAAGDQSTEREVRKGSGITTNLAFLEEFGTRPHRLGGLYEGARHPGNKPRPYMFPAARLGRRKARGRWSRAFSKAVKSVGPPSS